MSTPIHGFQRFYTEVFLSEHLHPMNVAFHVAGTVAAWLVVAVAFFLQTYGLLLLFPVLLFVPGLAGHRLFERNAAVGDLRVARQDYPVHWFVLGNSLMVWDLVRRGFHWR